MNDAASSAQSAPPPAALRELGFAFTGKASEYFGIWIVNLLLSIVTIGIYTAWAKVRRLRYFYGNTWLDGHNFEYHAKPKQILIGRLIVVGILVAINILVNLSPVFALLLIPYFIAFPWLINKSLAFNARMTSYRNVRFNFAGSYWGAMGVFLGMPIIALLSGGLLAPVASQMGVNYIGKHTGYGVSRFHTDAPVGALYANFGMTILFVIILSAVFGGLGFLVGGGVAALGLFNAGVEDAEIAEMLAAAPIFASIMGVYIGIFLSYIFYAAGVRNVAFGSTTLDGKHRLKSELGRARYTWVLVSNLFAVIFTAGLLRPWAAIRTWRYMANRTHAGISGSLDAVVDTAAPEGNVGAAEYFDIEGIDFGL